MEKRILKYVDSLMERYPILEVCRQSIIDAYLIIEEAYVNDKKLLIAGNGGSAADCEHIVGELMKRFKKPRLLETKVVEKLIEVDPLIGEKLRKELERGLPAISLVGHAALATAYINDVESQHVFAQQLLGFGREGDVFLGISTSGNSKNIVAATVVAKALNMKSIALTGAEGGDVSKFADIIIKVPEVETYIIQELHLPIYHCLCLMLEDRFFVL